jgi:outer membrane murein-binding lipoprotein Lpp
MNKFLITIFATFLATTVYAGELTHQFNSPAFSGNGYSTHVLTIHQLEQNRKDKLKEDAQAAEDRAERERKSTNLYKFQNNLESRIYAQLSKNIADSLFGEGGDIVDGEWAESETPFGDTIKWKRENGVIYVEVYDSNGDLASQFETPVGDFAF